MIAIPNMEKPKECFECPLIKYWITGSVHCGVDNVEIERRPHRSRADCPLIEIDDEIWEVLKPKIETMSFAKRGWITDESNT